MLVIIIHHAALELVNKENSNLQHNAIKNDSKRRNKESGSILLDIAYHQSAIKPDILNQVGRPDLIHLVLLQYHFLTELLEKKNYNIDLYIHTRNDKVFRVPQSWRVPVHFIRFRGLMEKLLVEKKISLSQKEKLTLHSKTLNELIQELQPNVVIKLVETGDKDENFLLTLEEVIDEEEKTLILIGGYQKGEYNLTELISKNLINKKLVDKPTTAWMIINLLLSGLIVKN